MEPKPTHALTLIILSSCEIMKNLNVDSEEIDMEWIL